MKSLSHLALAALLLLSFIACKNRMSGMAKEPEAKTADQKADRESYLTLKTGVAADSRAVTVGNVNEEPKTEEDKDLPQTGKGAGGKVPPKKEAGREEGDNPDWDKKIVKTADLKLEVKNFRTFTDQLHRLVKQSGGYIAQEQQSQSAYSIENTVTIRVPVDHFDGMLLQMASADII